MLFLLFFTRHPAGGRSRGDHFGVTMWPLAASGGWPLARGQLQDDLTRLPSKEHLSWQ